MIATTTQSEGDANRSQTFIRAIATNNSSGNRMICLYLLLEVESSNTIACTRFLSFMHFHEIEANHTITSIIVEILYERNTRTRCVIYLICCTATPPAIIATHLYVFVVRFVWRLCLYFVLLFYPTLPSWTTDRLLFSHVQTNEYYVI